ncbi:hypothetical protein SAMN05443582_104354 [Phyllobacterium sp. OV277]|nr:hypothetical protein SAMN05443582_104354 [Phyllobacterium sp. OV277]
MTKELDHILRCRDCGTTYLNIPKDVNSDTPIHCSRCGEYMGRWFEIETEFANQGGQSGVFKMDHGQITEIEEN